MSQSKPASSDFLSTEQRVSAKNETSRPQILLLDFKGFSEKRIGLSKLKAKGNYSKGVHIKLCQDSSGQNNNLQKRPMLFFMSSFGQCKIIPDGIKKQNIKGKAFCQKNLI